MQHIAVIGGGINGCLIAYRLHASGLRVTLFDAHGIAKGGSGAAGAFLSPKFSKDGELKTLINTALDEALEFYSNNFPNGIQHHNLLHIAKDEKEAQQLRFCKQYDALSLLENKPDIQPNQEYVYTSKSALVDADAMCKALVKDVEIKVEQITHVVKQDDAWMLNGVYRVDKVVLATGAYEPLISLPYKILRGVWGHRIDIQTSTHNRDSIHQFVSISAKRGNILSIGATHNVHYHPQRATKPYDIKEGREELLEKASRTLKLDDVKVVKDYVGLRSGSIDYLPILGEFVDVQHSLQTMPHHQIFTKKPHYEDVHRYKGLYIINGSAGYGFVLAPMLSRVLCETILSGADTPKQLDNARFFFRWAKRNPN